MHMSRSLVTFLVALFIITSASSAFAADTGKPLAGRWKMTTPARDAAGKACPFVPDELEYFSDGTMTMSSMPGNRLPFKTNLTIDERQAMEARDPSLKGKNLLLVKPTPQMEWRATPIVYSYSVTKNTLTLSVTGWTPATFTRVK